MISLLQQMWISIAATLIPHIWVVYLFHTNKITSLYIADEVSAIQRKYS